MPKILSILLVISINICCASDIPFDRDREDAYSFEEIIKTFEGILHPDVKTIFMQQTSVFFHERFGKSPHGRQGLVDCWSCYYESMRNHFQQENAANLQRREIYSRMSSHAQRVYAVAPDSYPQLQELEASMARLFPDDKDALWSPLPHIEQAPPQQTYIQTTTEIIWGALFWFFRG